LRRAEQLRAREEAAGTEVAVVAIGRKALNYYRYVGTDLLAELVGISDRPTFKNAQEVAERLINLYTNKEIDKVVVLFNHFKSAMEQKAVEYTLLPIKQEIMEEKPVREVASEYLYEPSDEAVLNRLLPTYIEAIVYRALLESAASEHGARRAAMKSATDNASEMIEVLVRSFNRARQAAITQEIAEIVGGAEALKNKEEEKLV
jgi:F-type H+-transporting ATPase subunit gamma